MTELPQGWASAEIPDVLAELPTGNIIDQGWSPKCENFPSESEETWGALKTTAIQDGRFVPQHTKQLPDHLEPKPALEVREGDLLMTCAGPRVRCGVICRVERVRPKLFISGKMYRFRPNQEVVDGDYLLGVLRSPDLQRAIDQIKTGGSESGLNLTKDRFKSLSLPLPPLAEQRRIVRKLDTLSARSTAARTHITAIETLVERYRQAVIDTAFSSLDLTVPLLELVDQETGIPYGIVQTGEPFDGGIPTVRAGDIKGFRLLEGGLKQVDPAIAAQYGRTKLKGGEVLIAIRGSVGETCVVPASMRGNNISREVALVPVSADVDAAFIMYFLRSVQAAQYIKANIKGVAQTGINLRDLKNLPCPDLTQLEQHQIVRRIEAAFAKIDRLAAEAAKALKLLGHLDQRILAKAFAGDLVPQDPTDEPAETLLARIRETRTAAPKSRRGRK